MDLMTAEIASVMKEDGAGVLARRLGFVLDTGYPANLYERTLWWFEVHRALTLALGAVELLVEVTFRITSYLS